MSRELRWARDGPSRRAPGATMEGGKSSAAMTGTPSSGCGVRFLLGYFFFFAPGGDPHFKEEVTRREAKPDTSSKHSNQPAHRSSSPPNQRQTRQSGIKTSSPEQKRRKYAKVAGAYRAYNDRPFLLPAPPHDRSHPPVQASRRAVALFAAGGGVVHPGWLGAGRWPGGRGAAI